MSEPIKANQAREYIAALAAQDNKPEAWRVLEMVDEYLQLARVMPCGHKAHYELHSVCTMCALLHIAEMVYARKS